MTFFKTVLAAAFASVFFSLPLQATTLQNDGTRMLDTSTNLLWLDLTETNSLAPAAADAAFPNYRIATSVEVLDLFESAGFNGVLRVRDPAYFDAANTLIQFLGVTANITTNGPPRTAGQGWADDGEFYREPFYETAFPIGQPSTGLFFEGNRFFKANRSGINGVGTFLVQSVPLPPALLLMMSALGLGLLFRRKKLG